MTNEQLATLRALAKAATPGPWHVDDGVAVLDVGGTVAEAVRDGAPAFADARYIAAVSPDIVLGLLDRLAAQQQDRESLAEERATFLRERDELAAEVAAYQGRPEGALPGWEWSEADGPAYVRPCGRRRVPLVVYVTGQWFGDEMQGDADSPRAAMRAAEAAARARGLLPPEGS